MLIKLFYLKLYLCQILKIKFIQNFYYINKYNKNFE